MAKLALFMMLLQAVASSTIKLCVNYNEASIPIPLEGASVTCFDEDAGIQDDRLTGTVLTDSSGCAILEYERKEPSSFFNVCDGLWDCRPSHNPDIYCRVEKDGNVRVSFHSIIRYHLTWS